MNYHKILFKQQNGVCVYCFKAMRPDDITIDHIVAKSNGGKSCLSNYVGACTQCNSQKKNNKIKKNKNELLKELESAGNSGYVSVRYICQTGSKVFENIGKKKYDKNFNKFKINSQRINSFTYRYTTSLLSCFVF